MTEISQSRETLNSTINKSSNTSQYFSVASSLDILNCSDEVYHSMDDGIDKDVPTNNIRKYECHKNHNNGNLDVTAFHCNDNMPRILIHESSVDIDDWDKVCDSLHSFISLESLSTEDDDEEDDLEDEDNNLSAVIDRVADVSKVFFRGDHFVSTDDDGEEDDKEEADNNLSGVINADRPDSDMDGNTSVSLNHSTIEGELTETNDVIYESIDSSDNCANENDLTSKFEDEDDEELIIEQDVVMIQTTNDKHFSESVLSMHSSDNIIASTEPPTEDIISYVLICENDTSKPIKENKNHKSIMSLQSSIVNSPIKKTSFLCCSAKRRKNRPLESDSNTKISKTKRLFSFLFFVKSRPQLKSVTKQDEIVIPVHEEVIHVLLAETEDLTDIPFIDEEEDSSCNEYFPLAKQEVFCE